MGLTTIDTSNLEIGEPIYYYFGISSTVIQNLINIGELLVINSSNITIQNVTLDKDGIVLLSTTNSTLTNNIINTVSYGIDLQPFSNYNIISNNNLSTSGSFGYGVYIENSNLNSLNNNIINVSGSSASGIYLFSNSENNTFLNNNIYSLNDYKIYDGTENSYSNYLIYNNSYAQINWTKINLTTNITLQIGNTIYLENNKVGLVDNIQSLNLNSSATIKFFGLSYISSPKLLKNGFRCDNDSSLCNITSWNSTTGILVAQVASFSNYTTQGQSGCGILNAGDYILTTNVSSTGTCFTINASNIILDCAGYKINYSTSTGGYAVYNYDGYDNITVKNCNIYDANNIYPYSAIYFFKAEDITFINNNITTLAPASFPYYLSKVNRTTVNESLLTVSSTNSNGVYISQGINCTVANNRIKMAGTSGGNGIKVDSNSNIYIYNNTINSSSNNDGIEIGTTNNSLILENNINLSGAISEGIQINNGIGNNFVNNIVISSNDDEISDTSTSQNALIYNNSYGEIIWNLSDLDTNIPLIVGINIYLMNNTLGLVDNIQTLSLNGSATIKFFGLNYSSQPRLLKNLVTCNSPSCNITSWNSTTGILTVEVASFSNYSTTPNSIPTAPTPTTPSNGYVFIDSTSRTPIFIWNNSLDLDADNLTYNFILDDNPTFNNPEINLTAINETTNQTNYTAEIELEVDTVYYWKVRAYDQIDYGNYSEAFNFTINSYLAISVLRDTINFGTVEPGSRVNTSNTTLPFWVENVGNIISNTTITATPYFSSVAFPSDYYQFRIEANESNAFNTTFSTMEWTNMSNSSSNKHVIALDWHSWKNDFLTGLSVLVPNGEPSGIKTSTVTFTIG